MGMNFRSREAELLHLNVRKEGPSEDLQVTAIDLKFMCETDGKVLCTLFGVDHTPELWMFNDDMDPMYIGIESIKSWASFESHHLNFGGLKFNSVKLKGFVAKLRPQRLVELVFQASITSPSESEICILAEMLKGKSTLEVTAPPDLFDEDQTDDFARRTNDAIRASAESARLQIGDLDESGSNDILFQTAVEFVVSNNRASISALQREFRISYNRAARMIEEMETKGIVSTQDAGGQRTVLATQTDDDLDHSDSAEEEGATA